MWRGGVSKPAKSNLICLFKQKKRIKKNPNKQASGVGMSTAWWCCNHGSPDNLLQQIGSVENAKSTGRLWLSKIPQGRAQALWVAGGRDESWPGWLAWWKSVGWTCAFPRTQQHLKGTQDPHQSGEKETPTSLQPIEEPLHPLWHFVWPSREQEEHSPGGDRGCSNRKEGDADAETWRSAANKGRRFIDQQMGNNGPNHKQPGIDRAELIMLKESEGKVNVQVKNWLLSH